jgi:hypothetical protein
MKGRALAPADSSEPGGYAVTVFSITIEIAALRHTKVAFPRDFGLRAGIPLNTPQCLTLELNSNIGGLGNERGNSIAPRKSVCLIIDIHQLLDRSYLRARA